ncbi:Diphosphoinositol polyphosphate phosphohydrolase DDP1 [Cyberlindnera fabianii]|uniref:Diphosphoinositol polyphosphate phosphohydrolase DDP1 n=1 Tax=Cyberlindnera fabianii TaxID=36022 RepID=A0A1V2L6X4_CYBFA|nr:Diphosphoinositol polyphosphate phosphohydrolase DDP1 [Cyberlindnera fabianii]
MADKIVYEDKAHVGRENQLFNPETGARMVAGCVCLNSTRDRVLLVSSSAKKSKWVLPKGGIELDEPEFHRAAIRETWEEAGVTGVIVGELPVVHDMRPPKKWGTKIDNEEYIRTGVMKTPPRSEFHFFEMVVREEHDVYPECKERTRKWFTFEDAIEELMSHNRPELAKAVEESLLKNKV